MDIFTILLSTGLVACIGLIIYMYWQSRQAKKEVLLLRPRDMRGQTLIVTQETDMGLVCKKTGGIVRRFIKMGPSWVFTKAGRAITRFICLEGTAYTAMIKNNDVVKISLAKTVEFILGESFYAQIPQKQRNMLENDKLGLTVGVEKFDAAAANLPILTADDLHDVDDSVVLNKLANAQEKTNMGELLQYVLAGAAVGALAMMLLITQNVITL